MLDPTGIDAYFIGLWIYGITVIFGAASVAIVEIWFRYKGFKSKKPIPAATENRQLSKTNQDYFNNYFSGCQESGDKNV
jgi:hypothetical protein